MNHTACYLRLLLTLSILSGMTNLIQAQSDQWTISGKVLDENGRSIYPVAITWGTKSGTINEPDGNFTLVLPALPAKLVFSLLGYSDKEILTGNMPREVFVDHLINLKVILQSKSTELKEVEIKATKETRLLGSPQIVPLDFEFLDSRILVLTKTGREYKIRVLDEYETEISNFTLAYPAQFLFRSCLGGIHAIGDTICQELILGPEGIETLQTYSRTRFDQYLEPCIASQGDKFILQTKSDFDKLNTFEWMDTTLKIKRPLYEVYDEISHLEAIKNLQKYIIYFSQNTRDASLISFDGHFADELGFESYILEKWSKTGKNDNYFDLVKMATNATQWQAMSSIRQSLLFSEKPGFINEPDSIYIFDPINSKLLPICWSMQIGTRRKISIPEGVGKHPTILTDELNGRVYWKAKNAAGYFQAIEWNLHDGNEKATFEVKNLHDGMKVYKIRDGYLYYIANPGAVDRNRYLYKSRLIKVK